MNPLIDDHRTCDHLKGRSKGIILSVVTAVAEIRGVDPRAMFGRNRGNWKVAGAKSMAMGICGYLGVPICHVARAFGRDWSTVYSAEMTCSRRYRNSSAFRLEWDNITAIHEKPE